MYRTVSIAVLAMACLLGCDCGGSPVDSPIIALTTTTTTSPDGGEVDMAISPADMATPPDMAIPVRVKIPDGMIATSQDIAYCFFRACINRDVGWRSGKEPQAAKNIAAVLGYDLVLLNDACAYYNAIPPVSTDPYMAYPLEKYFNDLLTVGDPWTKLMKCNPNQFPSAPYRCNNLSCFPRWRQYYDYFVPPRNGDKGTILLCTKQQIIPY